MTPSDRIRQINEREQSLVRATLSTLAEGVAVLLFLTMLCAWAGIAAKQIEAERIAAAELRR